MNARYLHKNTPMINYKYPIFFALLLTGCTTVTSVDRTDLSKKSIYFKRLNYMIKQPHTPTELLQNIKWAIEEQALLRKAFYSEEQLKFFTHAQSVEVSPFGINQVAFELSGLVQVLQKDPSWALEPTIELVIPKEDTHRLSSSLLYVDPRGDKRFTVDQLYAMFGSPNELIDAIAASITNTPAMDGKGALISPLPLLNRGEITHPLGSKDLKWHLQYGGVHTDIKAEIGGDGVVWGLTVEQREN